MKPIRSIKNQYLGINAHLHSRWQARGGWHEFHAAHIVDLTRTLKAQLLPMGYTAGIQDSLQIRRSDVREVRPEADIAIYDTDPVRPLLSAGVAVAEPEQMVLTMPEILVDYEELSEYLAIAIYRTQTRRDEGPPVAWIELLSPSNKLQDVTLYRNKRLDLLTSGVVFVELDYLHESPPTISQIPSYARGRRRPSSPNAHPYHIIVIDPRPELMKGKAYNHHFAVDEPLPLVTLPLNAGDTLLFDFGAPYHKTLVETFFAYEHVDYSQLPLNFDRYSEADQARIVARMVAVLEATLAGIDLEAGPFPVTPMPLAEGLARIDMLKSELIALSNRQSRIS